MASRGIIWRLHKNAGTAGNGYRTGQGNAARASKRTGEGFRFPGAGKKDGTGGKEPAGFRL